MIIQPIKTRVFQEREDLFTFITHSVKKVPERSIIAVTSKIVALAEGRTATIKNVQTKENFIRSESTLAIPTKHVWLTIKDGILLASAGIDESNANGKLILLPKDSFKVARLLRAKLRTKYNVKQLGVLIVDSCTMPLRTGVIGVALGYAGFRGIKDYRGKLDIFGRKFQYSRTNVADSLATTSVYIMGEGNEQQPLALIQEALVTFCDRVYRKEISISKEDDMYKPLFDKLPDSSSISND